MIDVDITGMSEADQARERRIRRLRDQLLLAQTAKQRGHYMRAMEAEIGARSNAAVAYLEQAKRLAA